MRIEFVKMNGAGNDFILVDNRAQDLTLTRERVRRLCDRHFGVGADGLMTLEPAKTEGSDWAWGFFNSDGSDAEMCGNGARCFAQFVADITGSRGEISWDTLAGRIRAQPRGAAQRIQLTDPEGLETGIALSTAFGAREVGFVNTGVPHAVVFVEDADEAVIQQEGRAIRFHERFQPAGTNVNFVQVSGERQLRVRTYERGVEGETLACGTGVTASALVAAARAQWDSPVSVVVKSGDTLQVEFDRQGPGFANIFLTGPATTVFRGTIDID